MRKLGLRKPIKTASSKHRSSALAKGDRFTATVRGTAADGNGVVQHPDGQVFFVPGVWPGEEVSVRVVDCKGRFGFAELVTLIQVSPDRIEAPCPYQGFDNHSCGGCPWQFITYDAQLQAKQQRVEQAVTSLLKGSALRPIIASASIFAYRNRAQLKTDGQRLGYLAASSHHLIDIDTCLILSDRNQSTLRDLRHKLPSSQWRPSRKKMFTTIDIDETVDADTASVNARLPFQQANSAQNAVMREWLAAKLAALARTSTVLELFAGSGNFTEVILAAGFEAVIAVEVVDDALANLRHRFPQIQTLACDLFAADAAARLAPYLTLASVLVLDPPRDGLKNDVLKSADGLFQRQSSLQDVFYISCDLATFVRDLKAFVAHGFEVKELQPIDQFPHTPHVELLAHLQMKRV